MPHLWPPDPSPARTLLLQGMQKALDEIDRIRNLTIEDLKFRDAAPLRAELERQRACRAGEILSPCGAVAPIFPIAKDDSVYEEELRLIQSAFVPFGYEAQLRTWTSNPPAPGTPFPHGDTRLRLALSAIAVAAAAVVVTPLFAPLAASATSLFTAPEPDVSNTQFQAGLAEEAERQGITLETIQAAEETMLVPTTVRRAPAAILIGGLVLGLLILG